MPAHSVVCLVGWVKANAGSTTVLHHPGTIVGRIERSEIRSPRSRTVDYVHHLGLVSSNIPMSTVRAHAMRPYKPSERPWGYMCHITPSPSVGAGARLPTVCHWRIHCRVGQGECRTHHRPRHPGTIVGRIERSEIRHPRLVRWTMSTISVSFHPTALGHREGACHAPLHAPLHAPGVTCVIITPSASVGAGPLCLPAALSFRHQCRVGQGECRTHHQFKSSDEQAAYPPGSYGSCAPCQTATIHTVSSFTR